MERKKTKKQKMQELYPMKYNADMIREKFNDGEQLEFVFFWGHTAKVGEVEKTCLSQWYSCAFRVDGVQYYTAEQYMMAQKAILFGDNEIFEEIMHAYEPKQYKALGRKIRNFNQDVWDQHKYEIVLKGNIAKFSQNEELKAFLLGTGECVLVEASPYDRIWGVGMKAEDTKIQNPNNWQGQNLLGFALMEARSLIG